GGEDPVHFLGERLGQIASAQTRLDMTDGDPAIKRAERAAKSGSCVSLDQNHIGLFLDKNGLESGQDSGCRLRQGLTWLHQIQIVIRLNPEDIEHLVQQIPMLSRSAGADGEFRTLPKMENNRGELYGF